MVFKIALFEIRKRLAQISTYVYFALFFTISFLAVLSAGGAFQQGGVSVSGSGGKIFVNAPVVVFALISSIHHFGIIITAAIMGQAVYQDFHHRTFTLFFTAPIPKWKYLLGRFLGGQLTLLAIFTAIGLGVFAATLMPRSDSSTAVPFLPSVDGSLFGPNLWTSYLRPYLWSVIPNTFLTGAIFFSLSSLTRRILPVYTGSVLLLIGYLIANSLTNSLDQRELAGWLDPLGTQALGNVTRYWTPAQQNAQQITLQGALLVNRALWTGFALLLTAFTFWRFQTRFGGERRGRRVEAPALPFAQSQAIPKSSHRNYGALHRLPGLTWLNFIETVKNVYFSVIVLAGVLFLILASTLLSSFYGTETYPITALVVELTNGSFSLFVLIIITFYSGEMVWRERDTNIHQLMDVLPIPDWLPLAAKTLALILIQVLLAAVVMLCGIAIQAVQGYFHFELGVYFQHLFVLSLAEYALICLLAISVQTLIVDKYLGHLVMIAYYMAVTFSSSLGFEHNLYKFGNAPRFTYSDMNGFGHFLNGIFWFNLYWAFAALLMVLVANLFWVRGTDTYWSSRWKLARQRFRPSHAFIGLALLLAMTLSGGWIYYNTCVLNPFRTSKQTAQWAVDYEKKYKHLADIPQPRIVAARSDFDLYPDQRKVHAKGAFQLRNKTASPISSVYILVPRDVHYDTLTIAGQPATTHDQEFGFYQFDLSSPLDPNAESELAYEFTYQSQGFTNSADMSSPVVANGTFMNSEILPSLGYDRNRELPEENTRKQYGLEKRPRMADRSDLKSRANNYISRDSDWISLESIVSTSPDQIAVVPGYLQREWNENGRRYFHYKTDGRILNFFSVLSARYQVRRDTWRGLVSFGKLDEPLPGAKPLSPEDRAKLMEGSEQDVQIEVYYHPGHEYNIDEMVEGIKASLDYYTKNFGPYQHRQARILEFPRYASFAQSFPNTIPYSEGVGFVARVNPNDPDDIDYPYYITAHEIAHQWWAHQVIGGNVRGATLMSETLSQYSALMVMKRKVGEGQMRKFLKYELDRYLAGRGQERDEELPLAQNENQQYIHYNKGSLVMYGLQDYIGEERVNRALARYIRQAAYQEPPYTESNELVTLLREETPEEYRYLIEDMFEQITLFDNRVLEAKVVKQDEKYLATVKVLGMKVRPDGSGADQEIPANDWIDLGGLDAEGKPLQPFEKVKLVSGEQTFQISFDKMPTKVGIDPLLKLIDRDPSDNVKAATLSSEGS